MKFLLFGLTKFIFQMSIVIFIIGYCFGFWFKSKNKPVKQLSPVKNGSTSATIDDNHTNLA